MGSLMFKRNKENKLVTAIIDFHSTGILYSTVQIICMSQLLKPIADRKTTGTAFIGIRSTGQLILISQ
jgi:AmiR/NasT family two-component response regulator